MNRVRTALSLPEEPSVDGDGVRVAVIDSGIDPQHPDFQGRIDLDASGHYGLTRGLRDFKGHGTHIAGIIAGDGTASDGLYRGIAPGAELIVLKALPATGRAVSDFVAEAVFDALDRGADVINYSAGQHGYQKGVQPPWKWSSKPNVIGKAFKIAAEEGVFCVAAAGNEGPTSGTVNRPAILADILAVGALSVDGDSLVPTSSRGPVYLDRELPPSGVVRATPQDEPVRGLEKPDCLAPGAAALGRSDPRYRTGLGSHPVSTRSRWAEGFVGVDPHDPDSLYGPFGGTSQAAAVASGLAALLIGLARKIGFCWGEDRSGAILRLMKLGALPLRGYERVDQGSGALLWPRLAGTLEDGLVDERLRAIIRKGPQLSAWPEGGDGG